jgi:hypothetical protein
VVSSGTNYNNKDYTGELWDELEVLLQVQEDDLIEQDEAAPTAVPGPLFNTPATPIVKRPRMPMSPTLSFQCQNVIPTPVSQPLFSP